MTFDLESTRCDLIAMRVKFGAKTTKGRICSKLVKQLDSLAGATGQQRVYLIKLIEESMLKLNDK